MASVLDLIQDFLCYGNSQCIQEFNRYAYQPIEGIFYLVFFPILFIIVFVYLLSNKLFGTHKGLRVLLAVAIFALIILQQWYFLFMQLGKMWYFGLIILGFFWLILYGLRGGIGGAQARAGGDGGGGITSGLVKRIMSDVKGETKNLEKELDMALGQVKIVEEAAKRGDNQAWRMAADALAKLHALRREYLDILRGPGGFRVGGRFKEYESKMDAAIKKLQHVQSKVKSAA